MAEETTTTTLTEIVNSEWIADLIMDYAIDAAVIGNLSREVSLAGRATKTAAFPIWTKDVGVDLTEANDLSNEDLETTETTVVAATVGILREVTDLASETNTLGAAGLADFIARDGALLLQEMVEDDLAALFADMTTGVGASGSDLTIANCVEAMAKMRTSKANGQWAFVFDDQQALDLTAAVAASAATIFTGGVASQIVGPGANGQLGTLFGIPAYYTNLTDTANAGADVVGILMVNGRTNPERAALGIASLWAPRMKVMSDLATVSTLYSITAAYGVGSIGDGYGIKIVTDA